MNLTTDLKNKLLLLLLLTGCYSCSGQNNNFRIEKKPCVFMNKYSGYKLIIHYDNDTLPKTSETYSYGLDYFIGLNDADKLAIIGELLRYENDTSQCCLDVIGRGFNGIEGCRGVPKSKRYTVQIDALYMINRLCWPKIIELYSCYNVLYDTLTKQEINNDPEKIKLMFATYKEWYDVCKKLGRIPGYFPFNDGRYVWFGQRKSLVARDY